MDFQLDRGLKEKKKGRVVGTKERGRGASSSWESLLNCDSLSLVQRQQEAKEGGRFTTHRRTVREGARRGCAHV